MRLRSPTRLKLATKVNLGSAVQNFNDKSNLEKAVWFTMFMIICSTQKHKELDKIDKFYEHFQNLDFVWP